MISHRPLCFTLAWGSSILDTNHHQQTLQSMFLQVYNPYVEPISSFTYLSLLNASKKRNFYNITYHRFKALLAFVLNEKHETIVAISRQYPFGTDKAVQIRRTACCDKGTQPQYFEQKKNKITLLIRTSDLNIAWLFEFQTF